MPSARGVALPLVAIAGALMLVDATDTPHPHAVSHDNVVGVPTLLAGAVLAGAAVLALRLSELGRRRAWLAFALPAGVLAVARLGALDQRVLGWSGTDTALGAVVAPAAVASLTLVALAFLLPVGHRALLATGALVLLGSHALLIATGLGVVGETSSVELAAGALVLGALVGERERVSSRRR